MIDRITPSSRLALDPLLLVSRDEPDWSFEILIVFALGLVLAGLFMLSTVPAFDKAATDSAAVADFWRHRAETKVAPETMAIVRIERDGVGFRCSVHNVRREWELAVGAECQSLGQLLLYARTTP